MGPRLFSRGNLCVASTSMVLSLKLQWGRGFSAAETLAAFDSPPLADSSFNGAAAFQPRKPRELYRRVREVKPLQWGRGFSAAETRRWGTHRHPVRLLQWGRGFSAAETVAVVSLSSHDAPASMGPRLFSRGNVALAA